MTTLFELNELTYSELPPFLVRRLEERTIRCLRIDSTVDNQVKFDIFERLNTGSVLLGAQELRNATGRGKFNELTKDLAKLASFRSMLQISQKTGTDSVEADDDHPKVKKMEDVELVLRFFSLRNKRYRKLSKGFKDFLTASLHEFNLLSDAGLEACRSDFVVYMNFLAKYAGPTPFAKLPGQSGTTRKRLSKFNASVFDAVAVGLAETFSAEEIKLNPRLIAKKLQGYTDLFNSKQFVASVTGSVNDATKVIFRIEAMIEHLT